MTTSIYPETMNLDPALPRIVTTATLAQVQTAGWLNTVINEGFVFPADNLIMIAHDQGASAAATDLFRIAVNSSTHVYTLSLTTNAISGPVVISDVQASATPGTVRALVSAISNSVLMTSGNLVGVRGVVTYVGASGGFLYGVQGKLIASGTISGSSWNAGVFGQLDISAATVNAGQMAPIWGDYGSASGTLTDQTGLYGIAMTNTTAAVLQGQIYLYGGAQNLLLLSTNAGLSGVTYFKDSGTGAGSWGNATPPTPSKVLKITVDGTAYYLPLVAQNT